jgi:hypothetical protein
MSKQVEILQLPVAPASSGTRGLLPPRRLSSLGDIRGELASVYRAGARGAIAWPEVCRRASVLWLLGRLIEGDELEKRITELERIAARR